MIKPEAAVEEFAAAKVNLTLRVTGRRGDGYHLIDSLVVFADVGDMVTIRPAEQTSLTLTGPFAETLQGEEDNLVLRAAKAARQQWPDRVPPLAMRLEKRLPIASGIGGGSADAAAALRAIARLAGLNGKEACACLEGLALSLGADVPVCLGARACRMTGIGEKIEPLAGFPAFHAVLANPGCAVSTASVFTALAFKPGAEIGTCPPDAPSAPDTSSAAAMPNAHGALNDTTSLLDRLCRAGNDLEGPARVIAPEIADCLDQLKGCTGASLVRMSGSGATCFALFATETDARSAGNFLRAQNPHWWVAPTVLR